MTTRDKNIETLKKVYARVVRGSTESEKMTAKMLLDKLAAKYNVSIEEIMESEAIQENIFGYYDNTELDILVALNAKIFNTDTTTYRPKKRKVIIKSSLIKWIEFKEAATLLLRAYRTEMKHVKKTAKYAFMLKNNLLKESTGEPSENKSTLTNREIEDIFGMSRKMQKVRIHKTLKS